MATMRNNKAIPMSFEEASEKFKSGVQIHHCDKGICLVSKRGASQNQRWWINLSHLVSDKTLPDEPRNYSTEWVYQRDDLTDLVNKSVWNINPPMRLYAH